MFDILSEVDWEKIMKDQNVPHTDEIFKTIENLKRIHENIQKYSTGEGLKETGDKIKEKGGNLWEKAKELTE